MSWIAFRLNRRLLRRSPSLGRRLVCAEERALEGPFLGGPTPLSRDLGEFKRANTKYSLQLYLDLSGLNI